MSNLHFKKILEAEFWFFFFKIKFNSNFPPKIEKIYNTPILQILIIKLNLEFEPNPQNGLVFTSIWKIWKTIWQQKAFDHLKRSKNWTNIKFRFLYSKLQSKFYILKLFPPGKVGKSFLLSRGNFFKFLWDKSKTRGNS